MTKTRSKSDSHGPKPDQNQTQIRPKSDPNQIQIRNGQTQPDGPDPEQTQTRLKTNPFFLARRSSSKSVPSSPAHKRISHVIDFTLDFNPESPISLRNSISPKKRSNDEISQKDSFYSTTDISQCETDREVQL